jgi:hypothetical protein
LSVFFRNVEVQTPWDFSKLSYSNTLFLRQSES